MQRIKISDIIKATGGAVNSTYQTINHSTFIRGVSIDSRTVKQGELFVAIKGERNDGHYFIGEAIEKGAKAVIAERGRQLQTPNLQATVIFVDDTLKALGDLAGWYRTRFKLPIIGIGGSNGKTTTKEITAKCLELKYKVCKSEGSFNSLTGVPISLFRLEKEHEVGVFEVGSNSVGEIKRLAGIVKPKIAVITNIGPTHLANFKSVEMVFKEESCLAEDAEVIILNADDPWLSNIKAKGRKIVWFGIEKGDLRAKIIDLGNNGVKFKVNQVKFELPLLGRHHVYNAMAAVTVGSILGIELQKMSEVIKEIRPITHREEIIHVNGIKIIDSTYNANPVSMELMLEVLAQQNEAKRRVAILGDMMELGEVAEELHRKIGKKINELGIEVVIGYGEMAKAYIKEVEERNKFYFNDIESIKMELGKIIKEGDVILVKGSRAMMMEKIVEELRKHC